MKKFDVYILETEECVSDGYDIDISIYAWQYFDALSYFELVKFMNENKLVFSDRVENEINDKAGFTQYRFTVKGF